MFLSSRILRSSLVLASFFVLTSAAGSGCATSNDPVGKGGSSSSTATGSGGGSEARCTGAPPACAGLDDFDCQTTNGCSHVGECQGTELDCASLSGTGCAKQPGCTSTSVSTCSGNAQQCFNFGNSSSCTAQKGCIWDQNNFFCSGSPTPCTQIPGASCSNQLGCIASQTTSVCQGSPTACTTLMAKDGCNAEIGCFWLSQCTGTATACAGLSDANCPYQPGCKCDTCGAAASSSTGPNPVCSSAIECDPTKDPCNTGNCVNGDCVRIPDCQRCVKQVECNPHTHACFTGNCVDARCQLDPTCKSCMGPSDCGTGSNACFTGTCTDGSCVVNTTCTSGDGCCPPGCAGEDTDCH